MVMYLVRIDLDVSSPVQIADSASLVSCRDYTSRSKKKYILRQVETHYKEASGEEERRQGGDIRRRGHLDRLKTRFTIITSTSSFSQHLSWQRVWICLKFCWYHVMCIKPQTNTNSMKLQRLARLTGAES